MKVLNLLFYSFLFFPSLSYGQIIRDVFSGTNISNTVVWQGDTSSFLPLNPGIQSRNEAANNSFYLSSSIASFETKEWYLKLELQFNPSSANYVDYVLMANKANLLSADSLYYVRIGNTKDEICLYRKFGNSPAQLIVDGDDNYLNKSLNQIEVRVVLDSNSTWSLAYKSWNNTDSPILFQSQKDTLSKQDFRHCGFAVRQSTSSFFKKHFFYEIYAGPILKDTIPPAILSFSVLSDSCIEIYFSEALDSLSANQLINYSLINENNEVFNPDFVEILANNIKVFFSSRFKSRVNYAFSIQSVKDLNGNAILDTSVTFRYLIFENAVFGEIKINEIMCNPTPSKGLPPFQYVELKNTSTKTIYASKFVFSDKVSSVVIPDFYLEPDSFIILCPIASVSFFNVFGKSIGLPSFPILNKTDEMVTIRDSINNLIHSVSYTDRWYASELAKQGGIALESISDKITCKQEINWRASIHEQGGTPGKENSVNYFWKDTLELKAKSATGKFPNSIVVEFNSSLDSNFNLNKEMFGVVGGQYLITSLSYVAENSIELQINNYWPASMVLDLEIRGLKDCKNNAIEHTILSMPITRNPKQNEVLITEIMSNPSSLLGLPNVKYIELYNRTDTILNLEGCKYKDNTSESLLPRYLLYPNSYVIISSLNNIALFQNIGECIGLSNFPEPNKTEELLTLLDPNGYEIHSIYYSDKWIKDNFKKQGGYSFEMKDPLNPCAGEGNWDASEAQLGGTPGKRNSIFQEYPDVDYPRIFSVFPMDNFTLDVIFTENLEIGPDLNFLNFSIKASNLGVVYPEHIIMLSPKNIRLNISTALAAGVEYTLQISEILDCAGNKVRNIEKKFALPEPVKQGDILINEILFNPLVAGAEYVEILNTGSNYLDLNKLYLGNLFEDGSLREFFPISPSNKLLEPHQILCLTVLPKEVCESYNCKYPENILQVNKMPSYPQRSGGVVLLNESGIFLDSIQYNEKQHFSMLKTYKGVSLERVSTSQKDKGYWQSAARSAGFGTPGYENSQFFSDLVVNEEYFYFKNGGVISPNGDGYNDLLIIGYSLPYPNFKMEIKLYSIHGEPLGTAFKATTLEQEGEVFWDAINQSMNSKVMIGNYILYIEAFHESGEVYSRKFTLSVVGN
jgi:hypothetical protein